MSQFIGIPFSHLIPSQPVFGPVHQHLALVIRALIHFLLPMAHYRPLYLESQSVSKLLNLLWKVSLGSGLSSDSMITRRCPALTLGRKSVGIMAI